MYVTHCILIHRKLYIKVYLNKIMLQVRAFTHLNRQKSDFVLDMNIKIYS